MRDEDRSTVIKNIIVVFVFVILLLSILNIDTNTYVEDANNYTNKTEVYECLEKIIVHAPINHTGGIINYTVKLPMCPGSMGVEMEYFENASVSELTLEYIIQTITVTECV